MFFFVIPTLKVWPARLDVRPNPSPSLFMRQSQVRVKGLVAVVQRGNCGFADKCFNAQQAGAIG